MVRSLDLAFIVNVQNYPVEKCQLEWTFLDVANGSTIHHLPRNYQQRFHVYKRDFLQNNTIPGKTYKVILHAFCPDSKPGSWGYERVVNEPPTIGSCGQVQPLVGEALFTTFTLSCTNIEDADTPLTYRQFVREKGLAPSTSTVSEFSMILPAGDKGNGYQLTVVFQAVDDLGDYSEVERTVNVSFYIQ